MSDCLDDVVVRVRDGFELRYNVESLLSSQFNLLASLVGSDAFDFEFSYTTYLVNILWDLNLISRKSYFILKDKIYDYVKENENDTEW